MVSEYRSTAYDVLLRQRRVRIIPRPDRPLAPVPAKFRVVVRDNAPHWRREALKVRSYSLKSKRLIAGWDEHYLAKTLAAL